MHRHGTMTVIWEHVLASNSGKNFEETVTGVVSFCGNHVIILLFLGIKNYKGEAFFW